MTLDVSGEQEKYLQTQANVTKFVALSGHHISEEHCFRPKIITKLFHCTKTLA